MNLLSSDSSSKENLIKDACDDIFSDDAYFEGLATSLKSVDQLKAQYKLALEEAFKNTDFEAKMNKGIVVIREKLPLILSSSECETVYQEFNNFAQNPENFSLKSLENPEEEGSNSDNSTEKIPDISAKTLQSVYTLGLQLLQNAEFEESEAVFTVLLFLNEKIVDFWIGAGVALFSNLKYEEAQEFFNYAKLLDPNHVAPYFHSSLCNQKLNNQEELENDYKEIQRIFLESEEEKNQWESSMNQLMNPS